MTGDRLPDAHGLVATSIRRPISVVVGVILTTLFGALALSRIPIQLTPDIAIPVLTVSTDWPGASPQEVESEILEPQEEALKSLSGLVRMESEARLERGSITLELEVGTSIEEALVRVTNLLSQVPSYPDAAREPVISAADSTGPSLAVITITAQDETYVGAYRTWVEERVQPRLERIDGVARVLLIGGQDREVEVVFDQAKLAARGLTISRVAAVLRGELTDRSAGDITVGKRRFLVRTPLAPEQPQGLEAVVLATSPGGAPVRLADVAQVRFGLRKPGALVYSDDVPSIVFLLGGRDGPDRRGTTSGGHQAHRPRLRGGSAGSPVFLRRTAGIGVHGCRGRRRGAHPGVSGVVSPADRHRSGHVSDRHSGESVRAANRRGPFGGGRSERFRSAGSGSCGRGAPRSGPRERAGRSGAADPQPRRRSDGVPRGASARGGGAGWFDRSGSRVGRRRAGRWRDHRRVRSARRTEG